MALSDRHAEAHWALAHHFENLEQQREAGTLGMWIFLLTEIMFFGGLFTAYSVYRAFHTEGFIAASHTLDLVLGGTNTVVLIASSLTMALAVYGAQTGKQRMLMICLALTILLGLTFLVIKYFEYSHKFHLGLIPGSGFEQNWIKEGHDPALARDAHMFIWIYFALTGLHALHMVIGVGIISVLMYLARDGRYTPQYHAPVEVSGLYWHFVDIVWIFLFPLLYLIR